MKDENQDASDSKNWTLQVWQSPSGRAPFQVWYEKLNDHDQAVVEVALTKILQRFGQDIVSTEWGKPLGGGLYEFRIRRHLRSNGAKHHPVLFRIFCTFYGKKIVLLFQGYDKGKDPSRKRQEREVRTARKYLRQWREYR